MGFREDIDTILEEIPEDRQTILFSATMPKEILDLTKRYQKNPVQIKVVHKELTVPSIEQYYLEVSESSKLEMLSRIIDVNRIGLSLVFCNTKKRVDELASNLQSRGYAAEALHGDMRQIQRDKVMAKFRKGTIDILTATDVAARGIDVDNIEAVFNYDIPNDIEYYVHRIGRTGRAGKTGKAYSFVVGRQIYELRDIQRYTKSNIKLMKPPSLMDVEENKVGSLLEKVKDILAEGDLANYAGYVERMLEEVNLGSEQSENLTTLDIAAALLKMVSSRDGGPVQAPAAEEFGDTGAEEGMVRLFINIGNITQVQPRHIVESIASNTGLPGRLIGAINIFDKYTFVDVPKEYASEVIKTLKTVKIKDRRVNVEPANRK